MNHAKSCIVFLFVFECHLKNCKNEISKMFSNFFAFKSRKWPHIHYSIDYSRLFSAFECKVDFYKLPFIRSELSSSVLLQGFPFMLCF